MDTHRSGVYLFSFLLVTLLLFSCVDEKKPGHKIILPPPTTMDEKTTESIKDVLETTVKQQGKLDDSTHLYMLKYVDSFYINNDYRNMWSHERKWHPMADSFYNFIKGSALYGLFPEDYHLKKLQSLKKTLDKDTVKNKNAVLWSKADLLLTDGFILLIRDLKRGRLPADSISYNKNGVLNVDFYGEKLEKLLVEQHFSELIHSVEPVHQGYWELKNGIRHFLDSMDTKKYTYLRYPYKAHDEKDSAFFMKNLQKRLSESYVIKPEDVLTDTSTVKEAIKKYQHLKKIKEDGMLSSSLVKLMNNTDQEKFKRIALTLDKYKQLPDSMPEKYIWVNLPSFFMQVYDHDTIAIDSKIICGKPATRTPLLNSVISDIVIYPTWTVPTSIISKQYLPKLKKNPKYLSKIGLRLKNNKGQLVDPETIDWNKYTKGIPYKVMQGSGDDNALGIMKFNFSNRFSVYLHDTNQRYLFKNSFRALSHGCVRVQEWKKLAHFIAVNDSINLKKGEILKYTTDSITNWLARKVKKTIDVKRELPLFIRYFSCVGKEGTIKFYDDIYGEDKVIIEKYFSDK